MKIKILDTGKTVEVNGSYGARMIEQGKAVIMAEPVQAKCEPKPEPEKLREKPAKK